MSRRVLFFGGYDVAAGYPRALSLRQGFEAHGVEVYELREDLLPTKESRRRTVSRPWKWPGAAARLALGSAKLRRRLRATIREHEFDALIVPYPGWFSVRAARKIWDGPLVLDLFFSLADTICYDREIFPRAGIAESMLRRFDRRACSAADRVLLDTPSHASRVAQLTGLDLFQFAFVPIGDPTAPCEAPSPPVLEEDEKLRALYVGTGVPLHGVETILDACAMRSDLELSFVGGSAEQRARVASLGKDRVALLSEWLDDADMRAAIDRQHVVFGIFGQSEKAKAVIPFKLVHGLAHSRVVITAETAAVQTLLVPGQDCLTTPAADSDALARVLGGLRDGPKLVEMTARCGRQRYESTFSPHAIGKSLLAILEAIDGQCWKSQAELHAAHADSTEASKSELCGERA